MTPRRWVSLLLLIALVWGSIPVAAQDGRPLPSSVREIIGMSRAAQADVMVELTGGSIVTGSIGRTNRTLFYLMDGATPGGRPVTYKSVRAFIDPVTGERLEVQVPGLAGRMPKVHTSLKAWLIAGAVVGTLLVVFAILLHGD